VKALVIYYSHDGNTRLIAQTIAEATGADTLELKPTKEVASQGFAKFFWGGAQVMMKRTPSLLPFDRQPQEYGLLFIGTPIWAWTYTPPLRTFFSTTDLKGKQIALFCCYAGNKGTVFQDMKDALPGNSFVGEIDFIGPAEQDTTESIQRASDWAKEIVATLGKQ
jgi:flavodoxin